jgi:diacylglycerol kinase family enzyme
MSTWALLRLTLDLFMGTWRDSPMVSEREVEEVTLHFPKRKRGAQAVIDGELIKLERSVKLRVHPGKLKVVLPNVLAAAE